MGQRSFLVLACLLALAGLGALAVHFSNQPRKVTLAVGPLGSEDARLAAAFVQGLDREKSKIRL
ncbi:MAG: TAXI family TRAP transporter solute-binding subunit, partial [Bosea sp. (in: a-proteobacteria)]